MVNTEELLADTRAFISTMHYVEEDFGLVPKHPHIGTLINFSDVEEMRDEFVEELYSSIVRFVYSEAKQARMRDGLVKAGRNSDAAMTKLVLRANRKFRKDDLRGQFSELLLFNLLQHHFKAAPLLRKMSITTNPKLERNGADAIHIARVGGGYRIYIGECKTYDRKSDSFVSTFKSSLLDVLQHYGEHRSELDLYVFEDFVDEELEEVARGYLSGTLKDVEVHLVCMISYGHDEVVDGAGRDELLDGVLQKIRRDTAQIKKQWIEDRIPPRLRTRVHYVIFPVFDMPDLLSRFKGYFR
jgi:hypothetical protein